MNPSYRDKLTDLGISDRVVEEIQKLNDDYITEAFEEDDTAYGYYHLEIEEFIK